MSVKQKKASVQNWLIYRLRGMHSVLTSNNIQRLKVMLPNDKHYLIINAAKAVRLLVVAVTDKGK